MNRTTDPRPEAVRVRRVRAGAASALVIAAACLLAPGAHAQDPTQAPASTPRNAAPAPPTAKTEAAMNKGTGNAMMQPLPTSVLIFPAVVTAGDAVAPVTATTREAQSIVTQALQQYLYKGGVGATVYSSRLPSVERAVSEGQGIKKEDADKGPGDDPRAGQRFADLVGAAEYLTTTIDNYKYDRATRRATFTLTITRSASDGSPLNTTALPAVGEAPADVAGPRQEGSAVARAAEVVAEQSVRALYPQTIPQLDPPPAKKARRRSKIGWIIPAVAVGAALIVPR